MVIQPLKNSIQFCIFIYAELLFWPLIMFEIRLGRVISKIWNKKMDLG